MLLSCFVIPASIPAKMITTRRPEFAFEVPTGGPRYIYGSASEIVEK